MSEYINYRDLELVGVDLEKAKDDALRCKDAVIHAENIVYALDRELKKSKDLKRIERMINNRTRDLGPSTNLAEMIEYISSFSEVKPFFTKVALEGCGKIGDIHAISKLVGKYGVEPGRESSCHLCFDQHMGSHSGPCSYNKIYGVEFPNDTPIDVILDNSYVKDCYVLDNSTFRVVFWMRNGCTTEYEFKLSLVQT